jgi:hypothetical protein
VANATGFTAGAPVSLFFESFQKSSGWTGLEYDYNVSTSLGNCYHTSPYTVTCVPGGAFTDEGEMSTPGAPFSDWQFPTNPISRGPNNESIIYEAVAYESATGYTDSNGLTEPACPPLQ